MVLYYKIAGNGYLLCLTNAKGKYEQMSFQNSKLLCNRDKKGRSKP